jgi:hypothetical protein
MAKATRRGTTGAEVVTPSQEIIGGAAATSTLPTASGRTLTLRKPGALQRLRLADALGADSAKNEVYFGQAFVAVCVVAIDGDPVSFPTTKRELEALVQRLDDEGLGVAALWLSSQIHGGKSPEQQQADLKN